MSKLRKMNVLEFAYPSRKYNFLAQAHFGKDFFVNSVEVEALSPHLAIVLFFLSFMVVWFFCKVLPNSVCV